MMQFFGLAVVALLLGAFVWRALSRGRFAVTNRRDAAFETADAAVVLVFAHAAVSWAFVGPWWWYLAVIAFAVGVFAIVMRWPVLPSAPRTGRSWWRAAKTTLHVAVLAAILWVLLF